MPNSTPAAPVASGALAGRGQAQPLPRWLLVPGWIALLGLCLSLPLPEMDATVSVAGALGVLVLLGVVFVAGRRLLPHSLLRWPLAGFGVCCLLSAIIPNLAHWPDLAAMSGSFNELWHTACAATAAGLVLALVRDRRDLLALICLLTLVVFMTAVAVPLERLLAGGLGKRVYGTQGHNNRYAILMFVSCFWLLMLALPGTREDLRLPRWALLTGGALVPAVVWLLFRDQWPSWTSSGEISLLGSGALAVALLAGGILLGGGLYLLMMWRPGTARVMAVVGLAMIYFNIAIGLSRMVLALFALLGVSVILLRFRRWWQIAVLLVVLGAGVAGVISFNKRLHPDHIEKSLAVRLAIQRAAWNIFLDHPVLGAGYGRYAFREAWTFPSPPPLDSGPHSRKRFLHAHNTWAQLLATQGVLGWAAFHFLYVVVIIVLARKSRAFFSRREPAGTAVIASGLALLSLIFLQLNGLLMLPLEGCNELAYWALAAIGLAGTKVEGSLSRALS
jgi:O-Antigen ligase